MHAPRVDIPWKEVAAAYQSGATLAELARKHNCSGSFVSKHLKDLGVPRRRGRRTPAPAAVAVAPESETPPWDTVRYRLVERVEKAAAAGSVDGLRGACELKFVHVEEGSAHSLVLRTVPVVSRQFQVGKEYVFSWEEQP